MACNKRDILKKLRDEGGATTSQLRAAQKLMEMKDREAVKEALDNASKDPVIRTDEMQKAFDALHKLAADNKIQTEDDVSVTDSKTMFAEANDAYVDPAGEVRTIAADMINDNETAKKTFRDIMEYDGVSISDSHKNRLTKVLDMFVDNQGEYLRPMKQFITFDAAANRGKFEPVDKPGVEKGVYVGVSSIPAIAGNQMSASEKYVHETTHAASEFAFQFGSVHASDAIANIGKLYKKFITTVTYEDLMPKVSVNKGREKQIAKNIIKYLSSGDRKAISEFFAYAMTNEQVSDYLENKLTSKTREKRNDETLFQKMETYLADLYDSIKAYFNKREKNQTAKEAILIYADKIAKANNIAANSKREAGLLKKVVGKPMEELNTWLKNNIVNQLDPKDTGIPKLPEDANAFDYTQWYAKVAHRLISGDKDIKLDEFLHVASINPDSTTGQFLNQFTQQDSFSKKIEMLGLQSESVDRVRENKVAIVFGLLRDGFKNVSKDGLSKQERVALTEGMLEIDTQALLGLYSNKNIQKLYTDKKYLNSEISKLQKSVEKEIGNIEDSNELLSQAKGLGYYMATGTGGITQMLNVGNIIQKVMLASEESDSKLYTLLDALASLEGMYYTKDETKATVASIIEKDPSGFKNMNKHFQAYTKEAKEKVFAKDHAVSFVKGELREISSNGVSTKVAPVSKKNELKEQGYKLVDKVPNKNNYLFPNDVDKELGLYELKDFTLQPFKRKGIRNTNIRNHRTSMLAESGGDFSYSSRRMMSTRNRANKLRAAQRKAIILPSVDGMVPITIPGSNGLVDVDYSPAVHRDVYYKSIGQEMDGFVMLSRMIGANYDKLETQKINTAILTQAIMDQNNNYEEDATFGKNDRLYIEIGPRVGGNIEFDLLSDRERKGREIWNNLPETAKKEIEVRSKYSKPKNPKLFVREGELEHIFGYREPSLLDIGYNGATVASTASAKTKQVVGQIDKIWKEIVSIDRVNYAVKFVPTLIGNIVSNSILGIQQGQNVTKAFSLQLQGAKRLKEYLQNEHKILQIEAKSSAGTASKKELREVSALKALNDASEVKPLIDAGLYTGIIEDVDMVNTTQKGELERMADKLFEYMPHTVRQLFDFAFITSNTQVFKALIRTVLYSDFASRYRDYSLAVDSGTDPETAKLQILKRYVNYGKSSGRLAETLNTFGFARFTKFWERTQPVIRDLARENPAYAGVTAIAQAVGGDISDVFDQSPLDKEFGYSFRLPMGVLDSVAINPLLNNLR